MTKARQTISFRKMLLTALCCCPLAGNAQTSGSGASLPTTQQLIDKVESCLPAPVLVKGKPPVCTTLLQRMADLHVNGLSIAVVHDGVIGWVRGYGVAAIGRNSVTAETLFQAGSISKPLAAMAALHLVQEGKLSLDANVNDKLKTWTVPASTAAPGAVVTLRELLTHTAGFTVHGFPGYAAGAPAPTLVQVLNGEPPANTPAIRLESIPGAKWNYSGGGYTVMQQLVMDVSGKTFTDLLQTTVLKPIGMTHSTYQQPLPAVLQPSAATPYAFSGELVAGGAHTYPEMAAAGLWTTPSDLARYILEVQESLGGKANHVLSPAMTRQMVTPGKGEWGLGLQVGGSAARPYFTHGGVNEGFESLFVAYEQGGDGAVVMTNAEGGSRIAAEVMSSIAVAYGWPDFQPVVRTPMKLDAAALPRFVGSYQLTPNATCTVTLDGDHLMTQVTGQQKFAMTPESPMRFFLTVVNAEIEFTADEKGQINSATLYQNGRKFKALRLP